jgi:hypothetical protein
MVHVITCILDVFPGFDRISDLRNQPGGIECAYLALLSLFQSELRCIVPYSTAYVPLRARRVTQFYYFMRTYIYNKLKIGNDVKETCAGDSHRTG